VGLRAVLVASERRKIFCPAGNQIKRFLGCPVRILVTIWIEELRILKNKLFLFKCSLLFKDAVSTYDIESVIDE